MPICVVVPTFNNVDGERYIKNIRSILQQEYDNFRVIVIDDVSEDGTGSQLQTYIEANKPHNWQKVTIQIN